MRVARANTVSTSQRAHPISIIAMASATSASAGAFFRMLLPPSHRMGLAYHSGARTSSRAVEAERRASAHGWTMRAHGAARGHSLSRAMGRALDEQGRGMERLSSGAPPPLRRCERKLLRYERKLWAACRARIGRNRSGGRAFIAPPPAARRAGVIRSRRIAPPDLLDMPSRCAPFHRPALRR